MINDTEEMKDVFACEAVIHWGGDTQYDQLLYNID